MKQPLIIKNSGYEWKFLWFLGWLVLFATQLFTFESKIWILIYAWLLGCSILSFIFSKSKYAILSVDKISILHIYIPKRVSLSLNWKEIKQVKVDIFPVSFTTPLFGILGPVKTYNATTDEPSISIVLNRSVSASEAKYIEYVNKFKIQRQVAISDDHKTLFLRKIPKINPNKFCQLCMDFKESVQTNCHENSKFLSLYELFIILIPISIFVATKR